MESKLISFCMLLILCSCTVQEDSGKHPKIQGVELPGQETKIIEKWRGTWDVKATRRKPLPVEDITSVETYDWILDGRYLRSETSLNSVGGKSMSMFWFDMFTKTYQYVIYDKSGFVAALPPSTWHESTQTMEWKSGFFSPVSYQASVTFSDPDTIQWKSLWKDWKGSVILDLKGVSIRRK